MIVRPLIATLAMSAALCASLPAYAQVTDQTDQSEEDWRNSQRKNGTSDIYRKTNPNSTGSGLPIIDYKPISPVERLPSESRRHVMRERAKAIAESDDGDISDAEYIPSEAAQSDEQLMRDEQEAWDDIVTDMQGSGGTANSEGGPNKVAVTGQNGATPAQGSRGGSTKTLQEIMDSIKNGQSGGHGSGAEGSPSSQEQSSEPSDGTSEGESGAPDGTAQAQAAQSDTASTNVGDNQSDEQTSGDSGSQSAAEGDSSAAQADGSTSSQNEPLSPLERIRRAQEERPTRGTERSASDYLGQTADD